LLGYARELEAMGHTITARWLQGSHQVSDDGLSEEAPAAQRQRFAEEDWEDLLGSECCISFTEAPRVANSRGGRHVEFGAAYHAGLLCLVVGPRENVFHCLEKVVWFPDWECARHAMQSARPEEAVA